MSQEYFPTIGKIPFEGPESKNPLAFHYYEPDRMVMGKKMKDWLRFAMAWWHTLGQASGDQFGGQTRHYAWDDGECPYSRAKAKVDAGFEIMQKLGIEYFCFHDIDLVEDTEDIAEYEARMKDITDYLLEKMKATGIKNLWGTANVFGNKRYMNGAATNPDFDVVARAAVQIKNALDATIKLGGPRRLHEPAQYPDAEGEESSCHYAQGGARLCPGQGIQRDLPDRAQADGAYQAPV